MAEYDLNEPFCLKADRDDGSEEVVFEGTPLELFHLIGIEEGDHSVEFQSGHINRVTKPGTTPLAQYDTSLMNHTLFKDN